MRKLVIRPLCLMLLLPTLPRPAAACDMSLWESNGPCKPLWKV